MLQMLEKGSKEMCYILDCDSWRDVNGLSPQSRLNFFCAHSSKLRLSLLAAACACVLLTMGTLANVGTFFFFRVRMLRKSVNRHSYFF